MEQIVFIVTKHVPYEYSENIKAYFSPVDALEFFELYKPDKYGEYYLESFSKNHPHIDAFLFEEKERFVNKFLNQQ